MHPYNTKTVHKKQSASAHFCLLNLVHKLCIAELCAHELNTTCFVDDASYLPAGFTDRACFEVIAIREGQLTVMHHDSTEEADEIIAFLLT